MRRTFVALISGETINMSTGFLKKVHPSASNSKLNAPDTTSSFPMKSRIWPFEKKKERIILEIIISEQQLRSFTFSEAKLKIPRIYIQISLWRSGECGLLKSFTPAISNSIQSQMLQTHRAFSYEKFKKDSKERTTKIIFLLSSFSEHLLFPVRGQSKESQNIYRFHFGALENVLF